MNMQKIYLRIPFLQQQENQYPVHHLPFKRIFDIFFSFTVLAISSPLFLTVAIFIKLTSPGPVFFIQDRMGRGGKIIRCVKFRTMYLNAEEKLQEILKKNKIMKREYEKYCKLKKDPRVTSIGRVLRKTSMDELPQFWNVLKGNLSVVGPRPAFPSEIQKYYRKKALKILSVRPGVTGIWQTSGRNMLSMKDRVDLEEIYVNTRSFFKDLILICKTIPVMLFSKGAY